MYSLFSYALCAKCALSKDDAEAASNTTLSHKQQPPPLPIQTSGVPLTPSSQSVNGWQAMLITPSSSPQTRARKTVNGKQFNTLGESFFVIYEYI